MPGVELPAAKAPDESASAPTIAAIPITLFIASYSLEVSFSPHLGRSSRATRTHNPAPDFPPEKVLAQRSDEWEALFFSALILSRSMPSWTKLVAAHSTI